MKIRMLVAISGTHDGEAWPRRGETCDVADTIGQDLCAAGMAEPVAQAPTEEHATEPEGESRDAPGDPVPTSEGRRGLRSR